MNISAAMNIATIEAKGGLESIEGIENRLQKAMERIMNHWMCTNEDEQFRAAIGAVMISYGIDTPEFERLKKELSKVSRLNAALSAATAGVPVDFGKMFATEDEDFEPIGIVKMWRNIAGT